MLECPHASRGNVDVFHELPCYSKRHLCLFPWLTAPFLVALHVSVLNTNFLLNFLSPDLPSHLISGTWHNKSVLLLPLVALTRIVGGPICARHITRRRRYENLHHFCPQMGQRQSTYTRELLYTDGYIAKMFGRLEAALYFTRLLQFDECYLRPEHLSSCGVFFTVHPAVQHVRPSTVIVGRPAWLLDCRLRNYGPVVPQTIWTAGDSERFCNVPLNMPILFLHCQFGAPGLRVSRAAAGNDLSGIMYGRAPAPVGNGCWTSIRINWPGYEEWSRQIRIRDRSQAQNIITVETLAATVSRAVCKSLETFENQSCDQPAWRVGGQDGITANHIILVGLIHVSQGSWQPILQLDRISQNKLEPQ